MKCHIEYFTYPCYHLGNSPQHLEREARIDIKHGRCLAEKIVKMHLWDFIFELPPIQMPFKVNNQESVAGKQLKVGDNEQL